MKNATFIQRFYLYAFLLTIPFSLQAQNNVGIGTYTPDSSAALDIQAIDQGILIPRMDSTMRKSISNPAEGLMVYDSTYQAFYYYTNASWQAITSSNDAVFEVNATDSVGVNVVASSAAVNMVTDDFVFGAPQLDSDGNDDHYSRFFFDKSKSAFRAGIAYGDVWDEQNIGRASVAIGDSPEASGSSSMALGNSATASGTNSVALGFKAISSGANATAIGRGTISSAEAALSIGENSASSDYASIAIGNEDTASGTFSIAIGSSSSATSYQTMAIGNSAKATDILAISIGQGTTASHSSAISIGTLTEAAGSSAIAIGENSLADNYGSIAIGISDTAYEPNSIAIGFSAHADGTKAMAIGFSSEALATSTQTFGNESSASAIGATALGFKNTASGDYSTAIGSNTEARSYGEMALGINNSDYTPQSTDSFNENDRLFVIGNGIDDANRSNALVMLKNGNTGLGTDSPDTTLHLVGQLKYADGNQADGLILTSDADGNASWAGTSAPFEIRSGVVASAGSVDLAEDDFVFGSPQLDDDGDGDHESRFFFDKSKSAFRAGLVDDAYWDEDSLGNASAAFGENTRALGNASAAFGENTSALGIASVAMGLSTLATGDYATAFGNSSHATGRSALAIGEGARASGDQAIAFGEDATASGEAAIAFGVTSNASGEAATAIGRGMEAPSYGEVALGFYGNSYTPQSSDSFNADDRLFSIGNGTGTSSGNRNDALVILKNGNAGLGTSTPDTTLHLIGQFKYDDGNQADGYVLISDADGNASWQELFTPLEINNNILRPSSIVDNSVTDFVFGSSQLGDDGNSDHDSRFFFDKSNSAFRAGRVQDNSWDADSIGLYSIAMGDNPRASGQHAIALGEEAIASKEDAIALGNLSSATGSKTLAFGFGSSASNTEAKAIGSSTQASGLYSTALGNFVIASGTNAFAAGNSSSASEQNAIAIGNSSVASATNATAIGQTAEASGEGATSVGYNVEASGNYATAIGRDNVAQSYGETVLGIYNSFNSPQSSTAFDPNDRLLVVGNGTATNDRSNALVMLKNGNTGLGTDSPDTTLHLVGQLKYTDGNQSNGYVLTSDANGNANWRASLDGISDTDEDTRIRLEASTDKDYIRFDTDGSERMTIDSLGNVGIGSSSPTQLLQIDIENNGLNTPLLLKNTNETASGGNAVGIGFINATHDNAKAAIVHELNESQGRGDLHILVNNTNNTSGVELTDAVATFTRQGNVGIGTDSPDTTLHLVGQLKYADGNQADGYVLTSDADGNASWEERSVPFEVSSNVVGPGVSVDIGKADFIFGSTQIDFDQDGDHESRFFFDKSKSAFRAGFADDVPWDEDSLGRGSAAFGENTRASGISSFAMGLYAVATERYATAIGNEASAKARSALAIGEGATATEKYAIALGQDANASGEDAIALGEDATATGENATAIGRSMEAPSYGEIALGLFNTSYTPQSTNSIIAEDRLFSIGNGTGTGGGRNDALVILKNGNAGLGTSTPDTTLHLIGQFKYDDGNQTDGAILTSDANGNASWQTDLSFTDIYASGDVGIGTASPAEPLHIEVDKQGLNLPMLIRNLDTTQGIGSNGIGVGFVNSSVSTSPKGAIFMERLATWGRGDLHVLLNNDPNNDIPDINDAVVTFSREGYVGIGTTDPGYALQVGVASDGSQTRANSWGTFSDRRWKKDLVVVPNALQKLDEVNGYYYHWKKGVDTTQQLGVIAQEVEAILPQCVSSDKQGYKSVDYGKLTAFLIQVNKEQQAQIKALEAERKHITQQQAQINTLETEKKIIQERLTRLELLLDKSTTTSKTP